MLQNQVNIAVDAFAGYCHTEDWRRGICYMCEYKHLTFDFLASQNT